MGRLGWKVSGRYGLAAAVVLLASLLRWSLPDALSGTPYLAYYPAVVAAAALGGLGPGVFATIASFLVVDLVFDSTPLWINLADPVVLGRLIIFLAGGVGVSVVAGLQLAAQARERQKTERLRESEEQSRAFFDNATVGAIQTDADGRVLQINDPYCHMTGYSRQELLTMNLLDLSPPEDYARHRELLTQFVNGRQPVYDVEKRYMRKDGRVIWVHVTAGLIRDANGRPVRTAGIIEDITDHKRAVEALRASEEKFRAVFEQAAIGMGRVSFTDARWIDVNDAFCSMLGYSPEEMRSTPWPQITHSEDVDRDLVSFRRMAAGELDSYSMEKRFIHKHGHPVWTRLTLSLVRDAQGRPDYEVAIIEDITDRKRAEESLRHGEQRLRATFDHAGVGLVEVEADDHFIAVNYQACQILGRSREQLLTMNVHELTWPEDRELSDRVNGELHSGLRDQADYEKRYIRGDGMPVWAHVTVSPIRDTNGRWLRSITTIEDITERKRAEEALRESESRFRSTFENAAVGMTLVDLQGNWLLINDTFCRMIGYGREVLLNTDFSALTHPDDLESDRNHYEQLMKDEMGSYTLEKRYVGEDGRIIWALLYRTLVRDAEGRPAYSVAVVTDITDRKQTEEALRESELFYRQTLESIPGMVFTTRPDGYCDYQSRQWVEFTGVPMSEMLGEGWNNLLHPDDRPRAYEAWQAAVEERAPYDLEYRVRRHDGKYRWFKVISRPIRDSEGRIVRWFGVALDIEDLKRAETSLRNFNEELEHRVRERTAQLQETVEELQRSNEDLEKFAYISSHDLQEPLRMVGNYVGLLAHRYKDQLDDDARTFIAFAEEGAQRMSTLIKDLLAYSRINTRGQTPSRVDSGKILQQTLSNLQLRIEETGAQVTYEELPIVTADPTQLAQIFQNLIDNALKYRKETEPPKIHITVERRDNQWLFCVRDNGIGINPEYFERIFLPFQRLHADRSRYPGSGIGLAIVKRIAERHHGRVCVESKPGEGTTFYFTLPADGTR